MGEESGALALGCSPIFSCLITTVGLGPGGAAESPPPPPPVLLGQIAVLSTSWGAARHHLAPDICGEPRVLISSEILAPRGMRGFQEKYRHPWNNGD